jgi:ADP-heptose:LPS heptosyltransferase
LFVPDARKIAVLRANALGDLMFSMPALSSLRAAYPEAQITLLGQNWHRAFFSDRPSPIDRVVVVPPYPGVGAPDDAPRHPAESAAFFEAMQREAFDLAIQLHGGGRNSNPFVQRLGARLTVGLRAHDAPSLDRWLRYVYFQSEIHRCLEVMTLVGAPAVGFEPHVTVTADDLTESRAVVPETGQPLVALHPGASSPDRRWPPEKFAEIGDTLAAAGARIVVTGTIEERSIIEAVIDGMAADAQDLSGELSLGGLAGTLARCRLLVSNDTGPLHLAAAVGTATVGIYWCFNLINGGALTRARHRPVVSWQLVCPICGANHAHDSCTCGASFVTDVPVDDVRAAALELFTTD